MGADGTQAGFHREGTSTVMMAVGQCHPAGMDVPSCVMASDPQCQAGTLRQLAVPRSWFPPPKTARAPSRQRACTSCTQK